MRPPDVSPSLPEGVATIEEQRGDGVLYEHAGWARDLPWLVQGITGRDADMSLFGSTPVGDVVARWVALRDSLRCGAVIHAHQVHEATVLVHSTVPPGLLITPDADGHVTTRAGALLAVSVADCVPIYIAAPDAGAVALLHGGWRGIAADILEHGISTLARRLGADTTRLRVHFGPAICGACYEVGEEVPRELGLATSQSPAHVDLRAVLAQRAVACGVRPGHVTVSRFCTRHGESPFYSHRGGCRERQIAVLAVRPAGE